jgi:hypothetical protein
VGFWDNVFRRGVWEARGELGVGKENHPYYPWKESSFGMSLMFKMKVSFL